MKLFICYIRQRRRGILSGILFFCIFVVSFVLYRLPVKAVLYPATLCFFIGIILIILDFRRVARKHEHLMKMKEFMDLVIEDLPFADGIEDEDYQTILSLLINEHSNVVSDKQRSYSEMVDYYTVWVHQIKTPIASMRLTLQNEDTFLSRHLGNDLFRIEQYVEMVLTFLRLNSESTDYIIREYDLDEIIRQSVKKLSGEFIIRKLRLDYEQLNVKVLTDEKWLSFVIEQVLSNALKYTPSGSISITMEKEEKLCIRDTGMGIAAEDLPRIFEQGFTGNNGRLDKKASGIGLYLCKRICERLGHKIEAESELDVGTCIMINFCREKLELE